MCMCMYVHMCAYKCVCGACVYVYAYVYMCVFYPDILYTLLSFFHTKIHEPLCVCGLGIKPRIFHACRAKALQLRYTSSSMLLLQLAKKMFFL